LRRTAAGQGQRLELVHLAAGAARLASDGSGGGGPVTQRRGGAKQANVDRHGRADGGLGVVGEGQADGLGLRIRIVQRLDAQIAVSVDGPTVGDRRRHVRFHDGDANGGRHPYRAALGLGTRLLPGAALTARV